MAFTNPGSGDGRDPGARRADPAFPQSTGLCTARPLPGLRRANERAGFGFLAGGASLQRPLGLPSHRFLDAQARSMPTLPGQGCPRLDWPGRGAGRRGGSVSVSRGATGRVFLRHYSRRCLGASLDRSDDRWGIRHSGGDPGRRQGPRFSGLDPGGGGGRGPGPSRGAIFGPPSAHSSSSAGLPEELAVASGRAALSFRPGRRSIR